MNPFLFPVLLAELQGFTGIDHELPTMFREKIGGIPGNHRILGHGWGLNDAIPKQTLDYLRKAYPGREQEIINIWRGGAKAKSALQKGS